MTLSIMTLSLMTLSMKGFYMTLSVSDSINGPQHVYIYDECHILFIIILNVIVLSVVMLNVIMLSDVMHSVVAPLLGLSFSFECKIT